MTGADRKPQDPPDELELDWGNRRRGAAVVEPEPDAVVNEPAVGWAAPPSTPVVWTGDAEDAALERRLRQWAIPVALAGSWLFVQTGAGRFLATIFSGMWLHELGHASVAWLCSVYALPGPWRTMVGDSRSFVVGVCVLAAVTWLAAWLWTHHRRGWLWVPAVLVIAQLVGTFGLKLTAVQKWMTFGGDAGAMVFGALLMVTFYARRSSQLRHGWLRWGFLVLGALGFMETADVWWTATHDRDVIPFGEIEGVGTSDPVRLTDDFGWSVGGMVRAYVTVSVLALALVAAFYVRGWFRSESDDEES